MGVHKWNQFMNDFLWTRGHCINVATFSQRRSDVYTMQVSQTVRWVWTQVRNCGLAKGITGTTCLASTATFKSEDTGKYLHVLHVSHLEISSWNSPHIKTRESSVAFITSERERAVKSAEAAGPRRGGGGGGGWVGLGGWRLSVGEAAAGISNSPLWIRKSLHERGQQSRSSSIGLPAHSRGTLHHPDTQDAFLPRLVVCDPAGHSYFSNRSWGWRGGICYFCPLAHRGASVLPKHVMRLHWGSRRHQHPMEKKSPKTPFTVTLKEVTLQLNNAWIYSVKESPDASCAFRETSSTLVLPIRVLQPLSSS